MADVFGWVAADWTITPNASALDIRYTGDAHGGAAPSYVKAIEFHRALQDFADDQQATGDDLLDISTATPSDRLGIDQIISLLNGANVTATEIEHLYDGSIIQADGDTIWDGIVNFGNADFIEVIQDNAIIVNDFWNAAGGGGLNPDSTLGISHRFLVQTRLDGVDIDGRRLRGTSREFGNTYATFFIAGTSRGNNVLSLSESNDPFNNTVEATVSGWSSVVFTEGYQLIDLDNDASTEPYFVSFDIGTQTIRDTYERAKWIQRRGSATSIFGMNGQLFRGITHEWAYDAEGGVSPAENDDYAWGLSIPYTAGSGTFVVGEAVFIGGSNAKRGRILALDDNTGTGTLVVAMEAGTPINTDAIDGQTSAASATAGTPVGQATGGGVARILGVLDSGTTGTVWVQLLKGTAPADNAICYEVLDATQVLTVQGAVTGRDRQPAFIGTSTGTNIIGAFGVGADAADVGSSDSFTDLLNAPRVPPNNQTFSVNGVVIGEDYVLVGPRTAGALDKAQDTLSVTLSGATESQATVGTTIPTDTPTTGTIRIVTDGGFDRRVAYASYTGAVFTFSASESFTTDNATSGNGVYITYIDKLATATTESYSAVFGTTRDLFVRVRDGGTAGDVLPIKTFEDNLATFTSAGGSSSVLRLSDA